MNYEVTRGCASLRPVRSTLIDGQCNAGNLVRKRLIAINVYGEAIEHEYTDTGRNRHLAPSPQPRERLSDSPSASEGRTTPQDLRLHQVPCVVSDSQGFVSAARARRLLGY